MKLADDNSSYFSNTPDASLTIFDIISDDINEVMLICSNEDKISFKYISPNFERYFDIKPSDVYQNPDIFFSIILSDDRESIISEIKSEKSFKKNKTSIIKTTSGKHFLIKCASDKNLPSHSKIMLLDFIPDIDFVGDNKENPELLNKMITKIRELTQNSYEVMRQNSFIKRVLASINTPFFVINTDNFEVIFSNHVFPLGEITPGSQYYEAIFGYEPAFSTSDAELCTATKVIKNKTPVKVERTMQIDGESKYFEILISPILNDKDKVTHLVVYWNDISNKKTAEYKLHESEDRFRSVFEEANIGMLLYDKDGQLVNLNKSSVEVLDIIDIPYFYKLNMFDISKFSINEKNALLNGYDIKHEVFYDLSHPLKQMMISPCAKDNNKVLSISISPLISKETKDVKNFLINVADITLTKKAEEQLKKKRVKAEQENKLKSDFLANVSHDLRTPLNAIINFSMVLSKGVLGEIKDEQKNIIDRINNSGKRLLLLINNLLDISKIESGSVTLDITKVYLPDLMSVITEAAASYKSRDVEIIFNMVEDFFYSDKIKLEQIMFNLASNAFKFTERGHVKIEGFFKDSLLHIVFEDTGSGIDKIDIETIFDKYSKSKTVSFIKGTGLGLAIVKELSKLLGGDIRVQSQLGQGSKFEVTIKNFKGLQNINGLVNNKGSN